MKTKRKLLIALFVGVFLLGVYGMLHRENPADKHKGYVYLNCSGEKLELHGDVFKREYNGKVYDYDKPDLKKSLDRLCTVVLQSDDPEDGISLSYIGDKLGASYDVYDKDMNVISENNDKLRLSGESDSEYYVAVDVKWGKLTENVSLRYYFAVEFK